MSSSLCDDAAVRAEQREWLARQFASLTTRIERLSPSAWAERVRYLPQSVTPLAGYYRFERAPYIREILDCLDPLSPIRHVVVMKGTQIAYTVGVLENAVGYTIDHTRNASVMFVTADQELAKHRLDSYVMPMLEHSGLRSQIRATDEKNRRRTGLTAQKIEWGGAFLMMLGANSANKLRSTSIQILLRDEIDGWKHKVGKDGDPLALTWNRTDAFSATRKVFDGSTPLLEEMSQIDALYKRGDRSKYMVRCRGCGEAQEIRWQRIDGETGVLSGILWDEDDGVIVPGSVRYVCYRCGHAHIDEDKAQLLSPEHGARWVPTSRPSAPWMRSFHIPALLSMMKPWEECVREYREAYDPKERRILNLEKYQAFYNNVLARPFRLQGDRVSREAVIPHRRAWYYYGQVPNRACHRYTGCPIYLLVLTVDVQKDHLKLGVVGFTKHKRSFLIEYKRLDGDTEDIQAPCWTELTTWIEDRRWEADDGAEYGIGFTFVDSGFRSQVVYEFTSQWSRGVFPIKGRKFPAPGSPMKEFQPFETKHGKDALWITVDHYKDALSAILRRGWDGESALPPGHFSAPADATDDQLAELTKEVKVYIKNKSTGKPEGIEWHRPHLAPNELWDLLVYAYAALDVIAWGIAQEWELPAVSWEKFWAWCEAERPYNTRVPDDACRSTSREAE